MKHCVASTGWIGLRDDGQSEQEKAADFEEPGWTPSHGLPDFFGEQRRFKGFQYAEYLGPKTRPLVDTAGRVFAIFGGHPDDPNWKRDVHNPAVEVMEEARANAGDSYSGGQTHPGALVNGVINTAVLCALMSNIAFIRLAGFATGVFANWAPNLFTYYATHMRHFYKKYRHLKRPFLNRRHLILWDCKIILEFPPGCTILLPSAAIFHSNIPIGPNERRYSFTQYSAGGVFRWIEHGFQSEEAYLASLSSKERARDGNEIRERWSKGVGLFSTLEELVSM
ncbi:hypothetical protein C8F04DRAFT_1266815 [Mycena alexandri]|uniref:Uncharacterized protein n=1 Tax=Mycena alexandri TaxID=1745969 RepID=A0AAD6SIN2_9AGAR|nr:hypothetical protein C8F04DRAFT_1266815 [Mycena alexandri]